MPTFCLLDFSIEADIKLGNKKYIVYPKTVIVIIGFIGWKQPNLITIRNIVCRLVSTTQNKESRIREDIVKK